MGIAHMLKGIWQACFCADLRCVQGCSLGVLHETLKRVRKEPVQMLNVRACQASSCGLGSQSPSKQRARARRLT